MKRKKKTREGRYASLMNSLLESYPAQSRFAESYRTLRTNVYFSFMEEDFSSLLITSASEQEGKTTTAANLAYTMAQAQNTVLMMDADFRKPALSLIDPSQSSLGLSGLLSDALGADFRSGSLSEFGLSDLYWLVSFQKKTGVLHLSEGEDKLDLHFLHGELADVQWLTRPEGKNLGTLLVNNKLLTEDQIKQALIRQKNTGQKLGFILINMGFVKDEDIAGFITLHTIEALRTGFQFKTGEFSFEKLPESGFEQATFSPSDLPKLYRQAVIGKENLPYLQKKISSAIVKTKTENLFILPTGPPPPNPAELLGSNRMSFLISLLKRQFDILIIDTPPILPASDAMILAPQTDGLLLVIKSGHINRELIKKAVEQIRISQANLIGAVLNQVDFERERYYSGKYYSRYYGKSD